MQIYFLSDLISENFHYFMIFRSLFWVSFYSKLKNTLKCSEVKMLFYGFLFLFIYLFCFFIWKKEEIVCGTFFLNSLSFFWKVNSYKTLFCLAISTNSENLKKIWIHKGQTTVELGKKDPFICHCSPFYLFSLDNEPTKTFFVVLRNITYFSDLILLFLALISFFLF